MTESESLALLREVLSYMKGSCEAFDFNKTCEAGRLAYCIRVIAEGQDSLLDRLNLKGLNFHDGSPDYVKKLDLPFSGLAIVTIGGKTQRYIARLENNLRIQYSPFEKWWTKPVLVEEEKGIDLNREAIVQRVANTRVGVVDSKLTGAFEAIVSKAGLPVTDAKAAPPELIEIMYASVRQIAFETLDTLYGQYGEHLQVH